MRIERLAVRGTNCYLLQGTAGCCDRPGHPAARRDHRQDDRRRHSASAGTADPGYPRTPGSLWRGSGIKAWCCAPVRPSIAQALAGPAQCAASGSNAARQPDPLDLSAAVAADPFRAFAGRPPARRRRSAVALRLDARLSPCPAMRRVAGRRHRRRRCFAWGSVRQFCRASQPIYLSDRQACG